MIASSNKALDAQRVRTVIIGKKPEEGLRPHRDGQSGGKVRRFYADAVDNAAAAKVIHSFTE
ncbi:hypothetical protein [Paraburkholderia caledonica]|uniref:hypothetical protein n=1 Tax=Paraburkholderia caledonica TaxID=134536 RepID=UPI001C3F14C2|nr:hypothetical protein [Paraburkholderia caledonica]